jgi:hypothetical protein
MTKEKKAAAVTKSAPKPQKEALKLKAKLVHDGKVYLPGDELPELPADKVAQLKKDGFI